MMYLVPTGALVALAPSLISKNGRRTLLNTAQITSVYSTETLLTEAVRRY
jgi:hypothetical protein